MRNVLALDAVGRARTHECVAAPRISGRAWLTKNQDCGVKAVRDLVSLLFTVYLTIAFTAIGYAMLFAGAMGARRVARFFFLLPLQSVLRMIGEWMRQLLAYLWYLIITYVLAPVGRRVVRSPRWMVTRERGWLRKR